MNAQQNVRGIVPVVPSDALVFEFPRGLPAMMLGFSLLCFGLAVVALVAFDPRHYPRAIELLLVVGFGLFGALTLQSFRRLRDSVAANSDGIWYLPRKGEPTFIAWRNVASVKADDTKQRLVLCDAINATSIRLEYQLTNFGRLREFVLIHAAVQKHSGASGTNLFYRTWINKGILLSFAALFLLFAWLSYHQGQPGPSPFFIAFACLPLWGIAKDPLRVRITADAVVVEYPRWKKMVLFDEITGIALNNVAVRGNVWAAVVIERRQGKSIRLFRFREGSVALHEALESAWRSGLDKTSS